MQKSTRGGACTSWGMIHNKKGLMTISRKGRDSNEFNKKDINDAIKYPLKGKVNSEFNDEHQETKTGKGKVINKTDISNSDLLKGKVVEIEKEAKKKE